MFPLFISPWGCFALVLPFLNCFMPCQNSCFLKDPLGMRNAPTGSTLSAIRSVFLSFYFVVSVVCRASANFFKLNVGITETSAEFLERGLPDFFLFEVETLFPLKFSWPGNACGKVFRISKRSVKYRC